MISSRRGSAMWKNQFALFVEDFVGSDSSGDGRTAAP
jgi:hypothetical protein